MTMQPYYSRDGITLFHADCRDVLPGMPAGSVDAVITDPPYGLAEKWQGGTWFTRGVYKGAVEWDSEAPHDVVASIAAMDVPAIIWGGNYFDLPRSRCRLAWQKTNAVPTMADWEEAWTNLDRPSKSFSRPCNGWNRQHPTEKPIDLMLWCFEFVPGDTILDPFAGSGTTLVAAWRLGRKAIGIELDERYCELAAKRLDREISQGRLFSPKAPSEVQKAMFTE